MVCWYVFDSIYKIFVKKFDYFLIIFCWSNIPVFSNGATYMDIFGWKSVWFQKCLLIAMFFDETELRQVLSAFLLRFIFLQFKICSPDGQFKYLVLIRKWFILALLSSLFKKGTNFPRITFCFRQTGLSITDLNTNGETSKRSLLL